MNAAATIRTRQMPPPTTRMMFLRQFIRRAAA
jgi:hypothetical protein